MKQLSLSKPHLLIMVGIPGSGKSFFAEKFSETFNAPFISYNHLEALLNDTEQGKAAGDYMLGELMKTHQSVLVEGHSDTRRDRAGYTKLARDHNYEPLFIWVQIDTDTAHNRATRPNKAQHNRSFSSSEHEQLVEHFVPLNSIEKSIVISGKHTYASQAKVVLKKLSTPRPDNAEQHAIHLPNRPTISSGTARHDITIG